jgi:hypothetical protein
MKNVSKLVEELFSGYANGIITDRECGDMIDLVTNTYTVVVDDKVEMDWDSEWENEEYQYVLEATQYDYI